MRGRSGRGRELSSSGSSVGTGFWGVRRVEEDRFGRVESQRDLSSLRVGRT